MKLTLAQVNEQLRYPPKTWTVDDKALLWAYKAELMGLRFSLDTLQIVLDLTEQEANDVFARLSEQGYVERR